MFCPTNAFLLNLDGYQIISYLQISGHHIVPLKLELYSAYQVCADICENQVLHMGGQVFFLWVFRFCFFFAQL